MTDIGTRLGLLLSVQHTPLATGTCRYCHAPIALFEYVGWVEAQRGGSYDLCPNPHGFAHEPSTTLNPAGHPATGQTFHRSHAWRDGASLCPL